MRTGTYVVCGPSFVELRLHDGSVVRGVSEDGPGGIEEATVFTCDSVPRSLLLGKDHPPGSGSPRNPRRLRKLSADEVRGLSRSEAPHYILSRSMFTAEDIGNGY